MLNNRISVTTIMYATASPCSVPLNCMFHQDSPMQWTKLRIWKISNCFVSNSLGKRHIYSGCTKYVCDKSENVQVCAQWQWNALDWCYWIALPASPVVQNGNMYTLWSPVISLNYELSMSKVVKIKETIDVCSDSIILVYIIDSIQAKGWPDYAKIAMT